MFYQVSEHIAQKLVAKKTITTESKSVYQYGIQQGFTIVLNLLTTLIIGLIFNMVIESFLFLAIYIPLRSYAGGIHAKTALRCYLYSSLMTIAVLLVVKFLPLENFICNLISLISGVFIFLSAPVDTENKKLDTIERKVYKKRACIILILEIVLQILLSFILQNNYIMCFSLAFLSISFVLLAGIIKNNKAEKALKSNTDT